MSSSGKKLQTPANMREYTQALKSINMCHEERLKLNNCSLAGVPSISNTTFLPTYYKDCYKEAIRHLIKIDTHMYLFTIKNLTSLVKTHRQDSLKEYSPISD